MPIAKTAAKKPAAKKPAVATKKPAVATKKPAAKRPAADTEKPAAKKGFPPKKKAGSAPKRAKRKPVLFQAPPDFKSHFLLVEVHTEKDGLIGGNVSATRYQGRFDPQAEDKKKFNLGDYDQDTLRGIAARLSGISYKSTQDRFYSADPSERVGVRGAHRMPKSTTFHVLLRAAVRKADNTLAVSVKEVFQRVSKQKGGKTVTRSVALAATDPVRRLLRRAGRLLPAAFKGVLIPPKRTRGSRKAEEAAEE